MGHLCEFLYCDRRDVIRQLRSTVVREEFKRREDKKEPALERGAQTEEFIKNWLIEQVVGCLIIARQLKGRRRILNHFYHCLCQGTVPILTLLESLLHVALFQQQRACGNKYVPTYVLTWGGTVHTDMNYCLKLPRQFFISHFEKTHNYLHSPKLI